MNSPNEALSHEDQILHLKRLLVTLKQHYEKSLQVAQIKLQDEQNQRSAQEKELATFQDKWQQNQQAHEEEINALRAQQNTLKTLLAAAREEIVSSALACTAHIDVSAQEKTLDNSAAKIALEESLVVAQNKVSALETQLVQQQHSAQQELQLLQEKLESLKTELAKSGCHDFETVVSSTSSHHLKQEIDDIKRSWAKDINEIKTLENRYAEVLNEKIALEQNYKQLQQQCAQHVAHLQSCQAEYQQIDEKQKNLTTLLQEKESTLHQLSLNCSILQQKVDELTIQDQVRVQIQEKYEQLREEWAQLQENFEHAVEMRKLAENSLAQLKVMSQEDGALIQKYTQQLNILKEERDVLYNEQQKFKVFIEEGESRFKIAQQHLAKKVKEVALLNAKVEEQQNSLTEFIQNIERQNHQLLQWQETADLSQKQEKRLQEQLHDALKSSENQVAKWEEKYFAMYDKWQSSELNIREMKKFEEKCHHMQNLLANLGTFMGNSLNTSPFFSSPEAPPPHAHRVPIESREAVAHEPSSLNMIPENHDEWVASEHRKT